MDANDTNRQLASWEVDPARRSWIRRHCHLMRSTCSISLYIVAQSETSDGFWNGFPISVVHYLSTCLKITLRNVPEFLRLSFSLRCFYARWMPVKEGIDICSQHHHTAHFALVTQQLSFKPLTIAHHVFLSIFPSSFLLNITQLPAFAQSLSPSTPNKRLLNYFFNTRQAKAQVPFCLKEKVFPQRIRNVQACSSRQISFEHPFLPFQGQPIG